MIVTKFEKIFHPKFVNDPQVKSADIGIVKFKNPIQLSADINVICIPFLIPEIPKNLDLTVWKKGYTIEKPLIKKLKVMRKGTINCSTKYFNLFASVKFKKHVSINFTDIKIKSEEIGYKTITHNEFCAGSKSRFIF